LILPLIHSPYPFKDEGMAVKRVKRDPRTTMDLQVHCGSQVYSSIILLYCSLVLSSSFCSRTEETAQEELKRIIRGNSTDMSISLLYPTSAFIFRQKDGVTLQNNE
jgi:hypothetical protein